MTLKVRKKNMVLGWSGRRSAGLRMTAAAALAATFVGPLRISYALAGPPPSNPQQPPAPAGASTGAKLPTDVPWALATSVRPARIKVLAGSADEAAIWRLFDGRATTGLATDGKPARFRAELPQEMYLDAVAVHGRVAGTLSVETEDSSGKAVVLLQRASLDVGGERWNRRDFAGVPLTRAVTMTFEPKASDAVLPELELWGRPTSAAAASMTATFPDVLYGSVPPGARELRASQGEQTISPATVSGPGSGGTFMVDFDGDQRGIDRAFLVYQLAGLPHFTAAARSINGERTLGRFGVSRGAKGGLQVEEISPAAVLKGRNRVQFLPADENHPESYRVSDVRIVVVPRAETRMTDASAREVSALRDGREATGWRVPASKPADVRSWEFDSATQPWGLDFRLSGKGNGTLTVASATARDKGQVAVKLDGLAAGWHRVALDKLPATNMLKLTLAGGREEAAAISELGIEGSPLPADTAPRLTITYPLSGECVNHRVHVRGFATPGAEAIFADERRVDGPVGRDGAFAFDLSEKDAASGQVVVEAAYAGNVRARRTVVVGRCIDRPPTVVADDGRPRQPVEDLGAPYGVTIKAGEAASLSFAGVKLDIPAGAVAKDVRLTVRPLPTKHVAPLDPGMTNISPEGQAFRFGPHGMAFKKPIRMTVPYAKRLIPAGYTESDVRTFYYNEDLHRWEQVGLLAQNDGEMVSVTDHFTDFINATIAMPEHPGTQSLNPTSLKDMKLADPAAAITLIAPPTANSKGSANLRLPIEVPPGRRGIQPDLAITYDSDRHNGWLGVGWDVGMSSIQVDTRFGVPKYDGTETYLLDGEMLAPATSNPPGAPAGPKYFQRRSEGRFDWIARSGSVTTGFTWLVTTKDGVKLSYGSTTGSRLSDPQAANKTFRWFLDQVTDPLQNQMSIAYQTDTGQPVLGGAVVGNGEPFVQVYPSKIDYTSHPSLGAAYHVFFTLGGPDGGATCNRPDTVIDGRAGFQVLTRCVLTQIEVKFQTQLVRRYVLTYDSPLNEGVSGKVFERGHFGKSLLAKVLVAGADGTAFHSHTFDYFATPETAPGPEAGSGTITALGTPVSYGALSNKDSSPRTQAGLVSMSADTLSTGTGFDFGYGSASEGIGAQFCLNAKDETSWRMLPFKGDGVADGYGAGGLLDFAQLDHQLDFQSRITPGAYRGAYTPSANIIPFSPIAHTDRDLFGLNFHVLNLSSNVDLTNRARETLTIIDIDGDGFPDLVGATKNGMLVSRNDRSNNFLPPETWANYTLSSNTCDDPLHHTLTSGASTVLSAVTKLIASVTGVLTTVGDIARTPGATGSVEATIMQNNQPVWRRTLGAADPPCPPGPSNSCSGALTITVQAGDRIYTQLRAIDNPNQTIAWSPEFTYQSVGGVTLSQAQVGLQEPYGAPIYRFGQRDDFKFVGRSFVPWTAIRGGTVDIEGQVIKQPTSDDLHVRVVKHRFDSPAVVLFDSTLSASAASTTPINLSNVTIDVGDSISFEVLSDLPIDPVRVQWLPIVRYRTYCATDPETAVSACSDVTCTTGPSGLPSCSLVQNPVPGLTVKTGDLQKQAVVFFPLFEFQPGTATKTYVTPSAGPVTVTGTVTKTAVTSSPVVVAVQGVHALYKKHVFAPGDVGTVAFDVAPTLAAGGQLFFTVYSDSSASGAISWNPGVNGAQQPVTFRSRAAGTLPDSSGIGAVETMAGGYHGWFYADWDSAVPFDETKIIEASTLSPHFFPLFFQPPRIQPSAGDGTVEFCDSGVFSCAAEVVGVLTVGPALIPVATDPNTLITAATAGGLYGLTQLGGCGGPFSWISCSSLPALRLTSSTNFDIQISTPLVSGSVNSGSAASRIDLIDMNGDGYPDAVMKDGTLFNTGAAFETSMTPSMTLPYGDLRAVSHFNYHLGASASGTQNLTDAEGRSSGYNISGGIGAGFSYGHSLTFTNLIDINGDGLPDHVKADPTGSVRVRLNLGRRFSNEVIWAGKGWVNQKVGAVPDFLNALGGALDSDTLRIEDISANNADLGLGGSGSTSGGVGGGINGDLGWTNTMVRTLVDFVDVNGDGLPDQALRTPGTGFISVKMNLGTGFDVEKRIPVTPWSSAGAPDLLPGGLSDFALGTPDDSLGYTIGAGKSQTGGGSVSIPCGAFFCTFSGSFTGSSSQSNESMSFEDIDGDGKVDQVLKVDGNSNVFARLNLTGKTNLLKHVTRPLGGSFDLDYQRTGNLRASVVGTHVDNPGNQWTLAQVTLDDGRGGRYIDTFDYGVLHVRPDLSSGFYDRAEREDYGYGHVVTVHGLPDGAGGFTKGDGSMVERWYENQDFYRKGLLRAEFEEDHTGKIFRGMIIKYKDPGAATPVPALKTGIFFPSETDRFTLFYEGASSDANGEQQFGPRNAVQSRHEARIFNTNGDLTNLFDYGDEQTANDDLRYTIVPTNETGTHITRPTSIQADALTTGQVLRRRTAVYKPLTGTLTTLTNVITGGKLPGSGNPGTTYNQVAANYGFTYDAFGNLATSTDPTNYQLKYTYDTTAQTYRTRVDDLSFQFASTASYDFRFGVVSSSTDINGQPESYTYDTFGRLCTVRGPDDQSTASEPTIAMVYAVNPASCPNTLPVGAPFPAYAVTRHKDVQHPGDPIDTAAFIDGIGRVIQTRKDAQFDLHSDGRVVFTGMNVSGQVLFDARGRVSAQGQPNFGNSVSPTDFFLVGMENPTVYGYDELGRPTSVNVSDGTPEGIQTTTAYSIVTPETVTPPSSNLGDGRKLLLTSVTDPRGNAHYAYADPRGNQVAVREFGEIGSSTSLTALTTKYAYDAIDQLLTVTDAKGNVTSSVYDTVGQMVSLVSKDAGQTDYRFDLNANLKEKQTAVLRGLNQSIKYIYDFNRLRQIDYPSSTDVVYTYGGPAEAGNGPGNLAGRIKQVTFDNGSESRFYDSMGNLRETRTTLNRMSTTTGLPASMTFNMKYTYDWLGRMQSMTFPNWINQTFQFVAGEGEKVTYTYDLGGNIDRITGHHQTTNPQQTSHPTDFIYLDHVGYDQFGSRRVLISGNGIANIYGYDIAQRLTLVAGAARGPQEIQQNRPPTPFHALQYEYDKNGNVTHMKNEVSVQPWRFGSVAVGPLDVTYGYDALNQLRSMTSKYRPDRAFGYLSADTYTYDEIGNMKTKAQSQDRLVWDNQSVNTQDLDPVATQLTGSRFDHNVAPLSYSLSYTYPAARPHGATPVSETPAGSTASNRTYTYDGNGNNTGNTFKADTRAQVWDEENRLKQVTRNGGSLAQFRYDDEGERKKKLTGAGDAWYVNQYFALLPGNRPTKHIYAGETRVATKTDAITMQTPVLHYYHPDNLGTTSYISDKDQNLVQHERYFAFGELWRPGGEKEETDLSRPDGDRREWLFTGKEWDVDTELYYFGARYFDPHADVWQSPDPILASYMRAGPNGRGADARNLGLYTYAWNNPVIVRDPTGEFPVRTYPWSPGNLATHQLITRNALWGHVTETVLRQITAANVGVDSDQGVSPESQSKHAMRAIDQDPANAKARWQARVESEFGAAKQALQEDRIDDARNAFGRATHTMQDSNATAHTDDKGGPQVWEGLGEVVKAKKHVDIDMAERSEGARAQRATQQTRALFERLQNEFLGDKPSNKAVETWRKFTGIK